MPARLCGSETSKIRPSLLTMIRHRLTLHPSQQTTALHPSEGRRTEGGTGRGTPLVPIAFHPTQDPISSTDGTTHALGCGSSGGQASVAVAIQDVRGTDKAQNGRGWNDDGTAYTLDTHATQVRRLTPVECERLMGFPDGYTAIPWRKKPASECPDGPRYRALGNSWAVPNVRWIGERIQRECTRLNLDQTQQPRD